MERERNRTKISEELKKDSNFGSLSLQEDDNVDNLKAKKTFRNRAEKEWTLSKAFAYKQVKDNDWNIIGSPLIRMILKNEIRYS